MASGDEEISSLSEMFSTLIDNLQFAIDQVQEGENKRTYPNEFSHDDFWNKIGLLVKGMSQESTKLCLAFSYPPTPSAEDSQPLVEKMEKVTLALVATYYNFPPSHGSTLQTMIRKSVIGIITGAQKLITSMKSAQFKGSPEQLKSTGSVWEQCDDFPNLPKDNKLAVLKVAKDTEGMVKDAVQEVEEERNTCGENMAVEDDDVDESQWSQEDLKTVDAAMGVLRTARALAKKVHSAVNSHGDCSTEVNNKQLDDLAGILERLSPAVDDFVLTLYPPMNRETILAQGEELVELLSSILSLSRNIHITTEDDQSWVEFLEKATAHNKEKLNNS